MEKVVKVMKGLMIQVYNRNIKMRFRLSYKNLLNIVWVLRKKIKLIFLKNIFIVREKIAVNILYSLCAKYSKVKSYKKIHLK